MRTNVMNRNPLDGSEWLSPTHKAKDGGHQFRVIGHGVWRDDSGKETPAIFILGHYCGMFHIQGMSPERWAEKFTVMDGEDES